jgi:TPR repeat protein
MWVHYMLNFSVKRLARVFAALLLYSLMLAPTLVSAQDDEAPAYKAGQMAYSRGDYTTAFNELQPLALEGNASAQALLGNMYLTGKGVPEDSTEAVRWLRLAADQGEVRAQISLTKMYLFGEGVPQDYAEAVRWMRLAADQGDVLSQSILGNMYLKGEGVPQDYAEAVRWTRLAADQGLAEAQVLLGMLYLTGKGVPEDSTEAVRWLRLAADQGDATAQVVLRRVGGASVDTDVDIANRLLTSQGSNVRVTECSFASNPETGVNLCYGRGVEVMFQDLSVPGLICIRDASSRRVLEAYNFRDSMYVPEQYMSLCRSK